MFWSSSSEDSDDHKNQDKQIQRECLLTKESRGSITQKCLFTKQVTQKNKKFHDGRLLLTLSGTASLEDEEGAYLGSADLNTVLGFIDRWNEAVSNKSSIDITRGFQNYLIHVPEPQIKLIGKQRLSGVK
jgi:Protein of unknown function (DUF2439)